MITLSNGHQFEFSVASGALGFDGRGYLWEWPFCVAGLIDPAFFTIVAKTVTLQPRTGNLRWSHPWSVVSWLRGGGVVNAIGLTNPGIDAWVEQYYPIAKARRWSLAVSIAAEGEAELREMASRLEPLSLPFIELNASCPNTASELLENTARVVGLCKALKDATRHPIVVKLSVVHDYRAIAQATEGVVEAISINSVPWEVFDPRSKSPLAKFGGGGVSGKIAQPFTWKMARELSRTTKTPVIAAGVWQYDDIKKLLNLGAKAVAFGSIFLRYPWRPTRFVKRWRCAR